MSEINVALEQQVVGLTPEIIAKAFWAMDSQQQAQFFDKLGEVIEKDSEDNRWLYGMGEAQWCALKDSLRQPGMERANKMHMALSAFAYDFWPHKPDGARTGLEV